MQQGNRSMYTKYRHLVCCALLCTIFMIDENRRRSAASVCRIVFMCLCSTVRTHRHWAVLAGKAFASRIILFIYDYQQDVKHITQHFRSSGSPGAYVAERDGAAYCTQTHKHTHTQTHTNIMQPCPVRVSSHNTRFPEHKICVWMLYTEHI